MPHTTSGRIRTGAASSAARDRIWPDQRWLFGRFLPQRAPAPDSGGSASARKGVPHQAQGRQPGKGGGARQGLRSPGPRTGGRHAVVPRLPRPQERRLPAVRRALRRPGGLRRPHGFRCVPGAHRRPVRRSDRRVRRDRPRSARQHLIGATSSGLRHRRQRPANQEGSVKTLDQSAQARVLRALHAQPPLVLANAWDPGSAVAIEAAGAKAIATTSAGVSWAAGVADGGGLSRAAALDAVRRIVAAVSVPVTADIESGYGATPEEVGATVAGSSPWGRWALTSKTAPASAGRRSLSRPHRRSGSRPPGRPHGPRASSFASMPGQTPTSLESARRASGLLPPWPAPSDTPPPARTFSSCPASSTPRRYEHSSAGHCRSMLMAHPGAPTIAELAALGVTRISVGSAVAQAAYGLAAAAARELLGPGTYGCLEAAMAYDELNNLLR